MAKMNYTAPKCKGATKLGHPCNNRIIQGDWCWLHKPVEYEVDSRKAFIVRAFKCPYCEALVEMP